MRIAFGQTAIAPPTSSNFGACSKTCGSKPNCLRARAALKPPIPPPMIAILVTAHSVNCKALSVNADESNNGSTQHQQQERGNRVGTDGRRLANGGGGENFSVRHR